MLVSIFGGLTLLSLGIIGEYLWRILDESRSRPSVVVDEVHGIKSERSEEADRANLITREQQ